MERVDLGSGEQCVREVISGLGRLCAPIELMLDGALVGKLIPPTERSNAERVRFLDEDWAVVEKARTRTRGILESVNRKEMSKAVREARARRGLRRR
jgi:hypothetical protein